MLPCAPLPQENLSRWQIETEVNLLLPLKVRLPPLFSVSINKVAVQMENCKKTCLQGLAKPGPRVFVLTLPGMGQLQPMVPAAVHGFNTWREGLPYPPKQNRAGVERACFPKCGLFLVCRMASTSKRRHFCAWLGVPAQGTPRASGAPTGRPRNSHPVTCTSSAWDSSETLAALYRRACA